MNRKFFLIVGLFLVVVAIIGGGALWWPTRTKISSIESTSASTPTAVPAPEATVSVDEGEEKSALQQIKEAFAEKYNKSVEEVDLTIDNNTGTHANGLVRFAGEVGGGWWLSFKETSGWIIVADGNGSVLCEDVEDYNFPVDIVPECWDQPTGKLIIQ